MLLKPSVKDRTTHYDMVPTLMNKYIGVKNNPSDYKDGLKSFFLGLRIIF